MGCIASVLHDEILTTFTVRIADTDALRQQAFAALNVSPGARAYYDKHRAAGDTHDKALRAVANRLLGVLHGCLRHRTFYDESTAWAAHLNASTATAA